MATVWVFWGCACNTDEPKTQRSNSLYLQCDDCHEEHTDGGDNKITVYSKNLDEWSISTLFPSAVVYSETAKPWGRCTNDVLQFLVNNTIQRINTAVSALHVYVDNTRVCNAQLAPKGVQLRIQFGECLKTHFTGYTVTVHDVRTATNSQTKQILLPNGLKAEFSDTPPHPDICPYEAIAEATY